MNSETEKVLEKVQKLMNLAENKGASEQEMETALRQAQKMLLRHNLTMEMAKEFGGSKEPTEQVKEQIITFRNRPWVRTVMNAIAKLYFCRVITYMGDRRTNTRFAFVGRISNVRTASLMAGFVVSAILTNARKERRRLGEKSAFESSFCLGAARRIGIRVMEMLDSDEMSTGMSLMVVDVTEQENQEFVTAMFPEGTSMIKTKSRGATNMNGYSKGDRYGNKIGLNNQLENEKKERIS